MIHSKVRSIVEHQFLKDWFFKETRTLIEYLKADAHFIGKVTQTVAEDKKENLQVNLLQYNCQILSVNDTHYCAVLVFPTPTQVPECYIAYLLFDNAFNPCKFYTVEKGLDHIFLCEWTQDMHINHGDVEMNPQAIFENVVKRFEQSLEDV